MESALAGLIVAMRNGKTFDHRGSAGLLFVGFALYLIWWFSCIAAFGDNARLVSLGALDGASADVGGHAALNLNEAAFFQLTQFVMLLFMGFTDQKLLRVYYSRAVLVGGAVLAALATSVVFALGDVGGYRWLCMVASMAAGAGSAVLLTFWGIAYSRQNVLTMIVNTSLAIAMALVAAVLVGIIPEAASRPLLCLLPLVCLPLLWRFTPLYYALRHSMPIFNPLPVNTLRFALRMAVPSVMLGIVQAFFFNGLPLGNAIPIGAEIRLSATIISGFAVILITAYAFFVKQSLLWDCLSRLMAVIVAACVLALPFAGQSHLGHEVISCTGFMLTVMLAWGFCAWLSQSFRVSPILVFGLTYSGASLGFVLDTVSYGQLRALAEYLPYGTSGITVIILTCIMLAYILLPRAQDIKRSVVKDENRDARAVDDLNRELQGIIESAKREMDDLAQSLGSGSQPASSVAMAFDGGAAGGFAPIAMVPVPQYAKREKAVAGSASFDTGSKGIDADRAESLDAAEQSDDEVGNGEAKRNSTSVPKEEPILPASGISAARDSEPGFDGKSEAVCDSAENGAERSAGASDYDAKPAPGHFRLRCERVANECMLSIRETEVLFLLAKGYSTNRIAEELYVSRNTAKTHIAHIYGKLNIHSRQELQEMIDGMKR